MPASDLVCVFVTGLSADDSFPGDRLSVGLASPDLTPGLPLSRAREGVLHHGGGLTWSVEELIADTQRLRAHPPNARRSVPRSADGSLRYTSARAIYFSETRRPL